MRRFIINNLLNLRVRKKYLTYELNKTYNKIASKLGLENLIKYNATFIYALIIKTNSISQI